MRRTTVTELFVETEEVLFLRKRRPTRQQRCDGCGREVEMLTPEEAAVFARLSTRAIYRLIETGRVHFVEADACTVLVCLDSLGQTADLQPVRPQLEAEK